MPVIDGLASGINSTKIIEGLLSLQQKRIEQLSGRQKALRVEQTAFATLESKLMALRGTLSRLASNANNALASKRITSTDESILTASATTAATVGTYTMSVQQLAQRHQVRSNGFASATAEITQGTFTLYAGGYDPVTIALNSSNNTVQGLTDAINAAGVGVTASVVSDGTGGPESYRILLTSNNSGTNAAITIQNNLDPSSGEATRPEFDLGNPVQAAQNARVTLGGGAGAITIESATNQVDNLIAGVRIDLLSANPTKTVQLSVSADTEKAQEAVSEFVKAYNDIVDFINAQSRYNPDTKVAGILLGNRSLISIQSDLQRTITGSVAGLATTANRLSVLGITTTSEGKLALNATRLQAVLQGTDSQVSVEAALRLFGLGADSTHGGVRFVLGSSKTKTGSVQVDVTSAAEQAQLTGTRALEPVTVIDESNNQFQIRLDGSASVTVRLAEGTYTQVEFAAEVQRAINSHQGLRGRSVSVAASNDRLQLTSGSYGRTSSITLEGGTALTAMGFHPGDSDTGQDVVGSFIVDGRTEPATGQGNLLIGNAGNAHTDGLQVRVTLKANQLVSGSEATLTLTRGLAAELDLTLDQTLHSDRGRLKTVNEAYDKRVQNLQKSIDRLNAQFNARRESLTQQFIRLETNLSQFQTLGNYLSAQLGTLTAVR